MGCEEGKVVVHNPSKSIDSAFTAIHRWPESLALPRDEGWEEWRKGWKEGDSWF